MNDEFDPGFQKKWYSFWMYNYDGLSDMIRSIRMKDINYWMQDWCIYRFQFHIKWIIKVSLHLVIRFCQLNGSPDDYLDQISHSYVTISQVYTGIALTFFPAFFPVNYSSCNISKVIILIYYYALIHNWLQT